MDTNALKGALLAGKVTINFTKVNGHKRTMIATLNPMMLPPPKPDAIQQKTKDASLLIVWDTEVSGWRTIKVDSISTWEAGEHKTEPAHVPATPVSGWSPNPTTPVTPIAT